MEIEGVNDGSSRLVVIVIDSHSGKAASDLPLLIHIHLDLGAKVLPEEMGCSTASYSCPDHRCIAEDQSQRQKGSVKSDLRLDYCVASGC